MPKERNPWKLKPLERVWNNVTDIQCKDVLTSGQPKNCILSDMVQFHS